MVRKTIAIKDELYYNLELQQITKQYQSFSQLVSSALQLLIKQQQKEKYKQAMLEASQDKLYLEDIKNIENDFKYSDAETLK